MFLSDKMFFGATSSTIQRIFTRSGKSLTISSFSFFLLCLLFFQFLLFIFIFFFFFLFFFFIFLFPFSLYLSFSPFVCLRSPSWEVVLVSSLLHGFLWAVFFCLVFCWVLLGLLLPFGCCFFLLLLRGVVFVLLLWVGRRSPPL